VRCQDVEGITALRGGDRCQGEPGVGAGLWFNEWKLVKKGVGLPSSCIKAEICGGYNLGRRDSVDSAKLVAQKRGPYKGVPFESSTVKGGG